MRDRTTKISIAALLVLFAAILMGAAVDATRVRVWNAAREAYRDLTYEWMAGVEDGSLVEDQVEADPVYNAAAAAGIDAADISNWDTAHADRLKWDGGSTGLNAETGRTSLGLGTMATQAANNVAITGGSATFTNSVIIDNSHLYMDNDAGSDRYIYTPTSNDLVFNMRGNSSGEGVTFEKSDGTPVMQIDGFNGRVGIGTATPGSQLDVSNTAATAVMRLLGVGGTVLHQIGSEYDIVYSRTTGAPNMDIIAMPLDGTSAANYRFGLGSGSTGANNIVLFSPNGSATHTTIGTGVTVFNEDSLDADFRVESNDDANMIFVDAGLNRAGFGTATPGKKVDIFGAISTDHEALLRLSNPTTSVYPAGMEFFSTAGSANYATGQITTTHGSAYVNPAMYIRVADGSKVLQNRMVIEKEGRVGIGTSSPADYLNILTANGTASRLRTQQTGWRTWSMGMPASQATWTVRDETAAADRITVDSAGNVGINTAPASRLHLKSAANGSNTDALRIEGTSNVRLNIYPIDTFNTAFQIGNSAGNLRYLTSTGSEFSRIDPNVSNLSWLNVGNFGIGTSTPAQKLDVAGNVKLSGELLGSKHVYTFTMNGMMAVPYAEQGYLMASGVFMSATRGVVMPRAGSITAYSICFDAVADGPTPIIEIRRNSTPVWSFVPDDIVGTGKSAYAVQARGTDTFAAGDKLIIGTATNEDATDVCIANVIMTVEVYFND